jgi:tRNA(fMet)-specific endonuclease VapC
MALAHFCAPLEICDFGHEAATAYGEVRVVLERQGTPTGPLDTLIAAHALALDATIVTSNEAEFDRVPLLRVDNWLRA